MFGTNLIAFDRDETRGILNILATFKYFEIIFLHGVHPDSSVYFNVVVLFTVTAGPRVV